MTLFSDPTAAIPGYRPDVAFSLTCFRCHAEGYDAGKALADGWTEIEYDDGASWNYLGYCPACGREASDE